MTILCFVAGRCSSFSTGLSPAHPFRPRLARSLDPRVAEPCDSLIVHAAIFVIVRYVAPGRRETFALERPGVESHAPETVLTLRRLCKSINQLAVFVTFGAGQEEF
ncbi:hypothetical protein L227DRAFT_581687 [Lentinus tigrinus ALCF2SS1-6]|uniref:Uncharacterized protein n=1 Tax=Lentinus tigrinus ALCF2SS1-6 TaxID=1328759 RepID=A0A5C2RR87_9APHY|nr:hypothetical protein L227DRAFT_581687 [Lentinus tigrinus ALCF2SS1-6]